MFSSSRTVVLLSLLPPTFLLVLCACATLYKPLAEQDVEVILSIMRDQERKVSSFYTSGRLSMKDGNVESEAHVLIVARRNPFRMKMEVTHPWGRPIVHILIDGTKLQVLSFPDEKLYVGNFTPEALSKFLPGDLDLDLIWAVLRGYPYLLSHHRTLSLKANQIRLLDEKGKVVEVIDLDPESQRPRVVFLPEQDMSLLFSDFQEDNGVYYARKVKVGDLEGKRNLVLRTQKRVINKSVPEQVFQIEKPQAFEILYLKEQPNIPSIHLPGSESE